MSRSVDIAIVEPNIECEAETADSPNKLYLKNESLVLLIDKDPQKLLVFNFNLNSKQASFKSITRNYQPLPVEAYNKPSFNSFLLDDKLYFVHASDDSLSFSIYDFKSGTEISKFRTLADEAINYKNTPILQEGGGTIYSQNVHRELVKTKQFLRKILAGSAVITAVQNGQNQHEVTIGAFKKIRQVSGGSMPMSGGALGGAMYGSGASVASWTRVTRFKMLIDGNTSKHIDGEIGPSKSEQIQAYAEKIKIPDGGSSIFIVNGHYQFAYYDRDEKKLIITKF